MKSVGKRVNVSILGLVLVFAAMPITATHLCGAAVGQNAAYPARACSCCGASDTADCMRACCRHESKPPAKMTAEGCACNPLPANQPPAIPVDPSQERLTGTRNVSSTALPWAASGEFGAPADLFAGVMPCKPPPAHVLCCTWRC